MSPEEVKETARAGLVRAVQGIIGQYAGMRLTLRQIYYRLVAGQVFANKLGNYKHLSDVLARARENGGIPWGAIEDRTREIHEGHGIESSAAAHFRSWWNHVASLDEHYVLARWWKQPKRVVVVLEKEALFEVFRQITDAEGVDMVPLRGYSSVTLLNDLANRIVDVEGADIEVLYFGDFDPSGADIERVADEKLREYGATFEIERVAITREQIEELGLPPAPAKVSDSRTAAFVEAEGVAWQVELDAIEPRALQAMIREAIRAHWDEDAGRVRQRELAARRTQIREWLDEAINPDFEAPEGDE